MKRALFIATLLALSGGDQASRAAGNRVQTPGTTPTFNRDVAPILFTHCVGCHRPDGVGPMSLLTFDQARTYAPVSYTHLTLPTIYSV